MTAPIPLVVLTGLLGSGKTTLLNRWLDQRGDLAVIINELGEIGIDKDLARRVGAPISLLAGGCVCCAVQGTLRTTLRSILTTVDTVAGEAALRRHPEALEQVTAADQLLLTKTNRATAAQRGALVDALGRLNPRAEVLDAERADAGLLDRDFPRQCRITGTLAPAGAVATLAPRPDRGDRRRRGRRHPGALAGELAPLSRAR